MILKSEKANDQYATLVAVYNILFGLGVVTGVVKGRQLVILIFFWVLWLYILISVWVLKGKTIIMDAEGCDIRFWKFRKKYLWSDFQTKRLEIYCASYGYRKKGIVFCKKRIRSMNESHPCNYVLTRPYFSYFYVTFPAAEEDKTQGNSKEDFREVDEEEFISKMKEWNVRIINGLPEYTRKGEIKFL